MKKLWDVEVAQNVVVLAETKEEAERQARYAVNGPFSDFYFEGRELTTLPSEWDEDCLPYGGEASKTIGQYAKEGQAPKYVEAKERAAKIYATLAQELGEKNPK